MPVTTHTITTKGLVQCSVHRNVTEALCTPVGKSTLHDDSSCSASSSCTIQRNESISQRPGTCQQEWQKPRIIQCETSYWSYKIYLWILWPSSHRVVGQCPLPLNLGRSLWLCWPTEYSKRDPIPPPRVSWKGMHFCLAHPCKAVSMLWGSPSCQTQSSWKPLLRPHMSGSQSWEWMRLWMIPGPSHWVIPSLQVIPAKVTIIMEQRQAISTVSFPNSWPTEPMSIIMVI